MPRGFFHGSEARVIVLHSSTLQALEKPNILGYGRAGVTKHQYEGCQNHDSFDRSSSLFKLELAKANEDQLLFSGGKIDEASRMKVWIRSDDVGQHCLGVCRNDEELWFLDVLNWRRTSILWEVEFEEFEFQDADAERTVKSFCAFKNVKRGAYLSVREGKLVLESERGPTCLWALVPGSGAWTAGEAATAVVGGAVVAAAVAGVAVATVGAISAAPALAAATATATASAEVAGAAAATSATAASAAAAASAAGTAATTTVKAVAAAAAAKTAAVAAAAAKVGAAAKAAACATTPAVGAGIVGVPVALGSAATLAKKLPCAREEKLWVF